jgi:hypothetical protein
LTFSALTPPERVALIDCYLAELDARHPTAQALARAKLIRVQAGELEAEVVEAERERWLAYLGTLTEAEAAAAEREFESWLVLLKPFLEEPEEEVAEEP